ncbi:MAG: metal-dependent hydrolase [Flavipsychrobacter sp.]|nr:metal-dependent hydrolase [Flavipsychrobacter sp.]
MSYIKKAEKLGKEYQNIIPTTQTTESMWKMMWKFATVKGQREPDKQLGPFVTDAAIYKTPPVSGLRITWLGHSSLLIEIDGKRILTDPVWGRASFLTFMGPKRFFEAPISLEDLPPLDAIILSHDHYDHLDYHVIKKLAHIMDTPVLCSIGVGDIIEKWGVSRSRITEMDWTDKAMVGSDCSIMALPARHFSGRSLTNRNQTLWSSFVIKGHTHNIYFGADSGIHPAFKEIGDMYGPFDLTMLEIGAYGEGWSNIHMGPANASEAHLALKGKV